MISQKDKRQHGFTLLEVLVALLVLSIGLLGLAGLQATSARYSFEAYMRSNNTMAAAEIIDKILMRTSSLKDATEKNTLLNLYASTAAAASCDLTIGDIATDLACWQESLANALPEGEGAIVANNDGSFTITISWLDRESGATLSSNWTIFAAPT